MTQPFTEYAINCFKIKDDFYKNMKAIEELYIDNRQAVLYAKSLYRKYSMKTFQPYFIYEDKIVVCIELCGMSLHPLVLVELENIFKVDVPSATISMKYYTGNYGIVLLDFDHSILTS